MAKTRKDHEEYLNSDHWQALRKSVIGAHPMCERCKMPRWLAQIVYDQDLHLHHRHYKTKGHEAREDVEVLCAKCHELETFGRSGLRSPKEAKCSICAKPHWDYRTNECYRCNAILGLHIEDILPCIHPDHEGHAVALWVLQRIFFAYRNSPRDLLTLAAYFTNFIAQWGMPGGERADG